MIVWTDVETTGLDERAGYLLEVALVVTDDELNEVAATSTLVQLITTVDVMDTVVREMHTKNELLDELKKKPGVPHRYAAEALLVEWVTGVFKDVPDIATHECVHCGKNESEHYLVRPTALQPRLQGDPALTTKHLFAPKKISALSQTPLAGSTVGFDRRWLRAHMPKLEELFSYRSIDVSSITELAKRWAPEVYAGRPKAGKAHRALADVRESIAYLKYYRDTRFIQTALPQHDPGWDDIVGEVLR